MSSVSIFENGNVFQLKGTRSETNTNTIRGQVQGFSYKSRKRIMQTVAKINTAKVHGKPLFITLTYPDSYSHDSNIWKNDLSKFVKTFNRKYSNIVLIWRLEFQKRGAPHFHVIAFNTNKTSFLPGLKSMREFISDNWYRSVGSCDVKHLSAGTDVSLIKSWRGVTHYVSKYISKTVQSYLFPDANCFNGRHWGIYNREYLPIDEITIDIDEEEFNYLRRIARRYLEHKTGHNCFFYSGSSGILIYIDYDTAFRLLEYSNHNKTLRNDTDITHLTRRLERKLP